jgi:hypothetical protein
MSFNLPAFLATWDPPLFADRYLALIDSQVAPVSFVLVVLIPSWRPFAACPKNAMLAPPPPGNMVPVPRFAMSDPAGGY